MNEGIKSPKLVFEEKKAIKLFLWLFYIFYISFDLFYDILIPIYAKKETIGILNTGLGLWLYVLILGLLPIAFYLIKKDNPYPVKYLYLFGYIILDTVNNLIIYLGSTKTFSAGNIVEILFVVFSPVFVSKKYFWTVTIGIIGKYFFIGLILHDKVVLYPMIILLPISAIAFTILNRFFSYINTLTDMHEELLQKEKLAVIGQMSTAIGHEIRNPLSSLKGFIQLQRESYPNTNDFYPIMIEEVDRINSIVSDLMDLGKPRVITFEKSNIEEIIAYTTSITQQQAQGKGVTIETITEEPLPPIYCDEKQLKQVFINLIKNAIEAMSEGGRIKIKLKTILGQKLYVAIEDEGCGIPEENIPNLVEPFFTTKKEGTGLGLMVSNQIIKDHKGVLNIKSISEKGTTVEILLPLQQSKAFF
ncbi:ATP-binding protein [Neobacillus massiliamazoniensis]|uniref:histidine kinase n=1 Tax=Neobacillus massiliamazoniensis TaxID=1499688 RepID=A0A0U1NVA0_9BACI|nr:ATP-binding protein [Neobacillus massiliamazoniensis]CRK81943.1 histidine kinase [Neobacillus massiliamazoniensis]